MGVNRSSSQLRAINGQKWGDKGHLELKKGYFILKESIGTHWSQLKLFFSSPAIEEHWSHWDSWLSNRADWMPV